MFDSVAIANRGEITVRIIGTLRSMGIRSVVLFTDVDRSAPQVALADEAVCIEAPNAYLDVDSVVSAALSAGAHALHPGYGFLSENPLLAEACGSAGITFVGPPASAIRAMGDKINAKQLVSAAGVPVVPGRDGRSLDDEALAAAALDVGLPVLLKPSAGGGGKGMHRVDDPDRLLEAIRAARREANSAFGDGTLLVERFVSRPRHIEVQVLADTHGHVVALGERECSLQRRHQKIVEETPSPLLDPETRRAMESAAVSAAKACGYVNAGTVEFIVSSERPGEFFFMEMNTRLQVEHPVTEMVRRIDLVEYQLRVACGEPLPWSSQDAVPPPVGHAIEARLYAEDPSSGFLPATGTVRAWHPPTTPGVRIDSGIAVGLEVGTDYDPMLAKLIAWAPDRAQSLRTLRSALAETAVVGVTTNAGYLRRLLNHPAVAAGDLDTELVERINQSVSPGDDRWVAAAAAILDELIRQENAAGPWELGDGWRVGGPVPRRSTWKLHDEQVEVLLSGPIGHGTVTWGGTDPVEARAQVGGDRLELQLAGRHRNVVFAKAEDRTWVSCEGYSWEVLRERATVAHAGPALGGPGPVNSPMPGTVLAVHVQAGDTVVAGQALVTVEAMKMEHVVSAQLDGTVAELLVRTGDSVALGQPLVELASLDPS